MAGSSPEIALDNYVEQARIAISCLASATAFGSGMSELGLNSLTFFADRQPYPNRIRLTTHQGSGELVLRVIQRYNLIFHPDAILRAKYEVWTSYYQFKILDRSEHEIVAFHWDLDGKSPIKHPHVHLPAAEPVTLSQPDGSSQAGRKTYLNKLHIPTGRIALEDVVEFLITDFHVDPLLPNWNEVLDEARLSSNR